MSDFIWTYVLGVFITGNLLGIWFESTIFLHLFSKFANKEIYTFDDLIDLIDDKSQYFADLFSCVWCLGTWLSVFVLFFMRFFLEVPPLFAVSCIFSWPLICAKIFKINK